MKAAAAGALFLSLLVAGCGAGPGATAGPGEASAAGAARQRVTGTVPAPGTCVYRRSGSGAVLPDPHCTPGAVDPAVTQADIAATICVRGYTTGVRPVVQETDRAKRLLMVAYGDHEGAGAYELDHLIPLELGGASDVSNLWPEPGASPNPKDHVETELHDLVCAQVWHAGRPYLPLDTARRLIAGDWTTAVVQAQGAMRG